MMTMGSDFQFENAWQNYKNLDKLIKYVNEQVGDLILVDVYISKCMNRRRFVNSKTKLPKLLYKYQRLIDQSTNSAYLQCLLNFLH